ncbi:PPC domain-containing protein [bacterium]|nr:PPC domain-containing protein [bacterium]
MKRFIFLAIVSAVIFTFVACGGGKKSKPEVDDGPVETEDSDVDDGESVVPDGDEDSSEDGNGNDGDSGYKPGGDSDSDGDSDQQPGGDSDTPVVPDNDDPEANDPCDPNPCTEKNKTVCTATGTGYTCSCDRLTCEINGACIADGERNPSNSCEECNRDYSKTSWSQVADGRDCEAKDGLMGSGICRSGVCGGFGTCDNRVYGLKAGAPCNKDVECETGYCYTWYDYSGSDSYGFVRASVCTGTCKEDEDCPNNMTCQFMESRGYQCMPLFVAGVERPSPKMKTFGPCNVDEDCEGGLCLSYGEGESFCSEECTKNLISDSCGSCGKCMEGGSDKGFKYDKYCVPKGSGELGNHCQSGMDCSSGGCYDGYCVKTCGSIFSSCGSGYECGTLPDYFGSSEVCFDKNRFNLPDGTYCNYDDQCASGECIEFEGDKICGSHCTDSEVTDPETGSATTTKTCANGSQCLAVKKTSDFGSYAEYICAQDKMLKRVEFGQDCYSDWQCADGYSCFGGYFCSKACTKDSECEIDKTCYVYGQQESEEGGDPQILGVCISKEQQSFKPGEYCPYVWSCENCYTDYTIQQYYCTKSCESDADCFDIGGCYDGICQKAYPYRSDVYASCRFDDDCEKFTNCEHGTCTSSCSSDSSCDGYDAVTPTGTQKTCRPCETDTDCKKVFYDYGMCLTDYDGNKYCVEDCEQNYTLCPEGTRCNGHYCYPVSGSCKEGKAFCNSENNCAVPTLLDDWICDADKECLSGKCYDNYCQNLTCSTDEDCGCGFKECRSGSCVPKKSLGTLETEPNNDLASAQEVSNGFVFAGFGHKNNEEDFDYFKFKAKAGQYLKVRTHPYCGENRADTYIALLDENGSQLAVNEDMDYAHFAQHYYSEIMDYKAPADGYYYVLVRQSPMYRQALYNMPYILEIDSFDPDANNTCEGAKELEPGTYHESVKKALDSADTSSCTDFYSWGPDLFYKVNVPAGKIMTLRVTPESGAFDPTISVLSGCGEIEDTCLAGNAFGGFGDPEEIIYYNDSGSDAEYIIVIDTAAAPLEYDFTIQLDINDTPPVPENDKIEGAIALEGKGNLQGLTISAEDDYAPTAGICENASLTGKDVVYSMNMAAGDYFHAQINAAFAASIYVVKSDDLDTCIYGGGLINFETDATTAGIYYLIIDSNDATAYGTFSISYIKEATDKDSCKGICSSSYRMCLPDKTDLCMCDSSLGLLYTANCDSYCRSEDVGGLGGSCETSYTDSGSIERNGCVCTYDCSDTEKVAELCSDQEPSNCTCGPADACSWKNNGSCDKMCSDFFPTDHFDDSADCQ